MGAAYKFGWIPDEERAYECAHVWSREKTTGPERLVIAPRARQVDLILEFLRVMPEPFWILYELKVPRGKGEPGRYQSAEPLNRREAEAFLRRFEAFFENDGRHDIWIASTTTSDLLVYDSHNVIYAYVQMPELEGLLSQRGLTKVNRVSFPVPHSHKYNQEFDDEQQEVLKYLTWKVSPLQESDD